MSIPRHAYLSDLAAKRISELQSEGVEVTPADAVMLNAICWGMRGVGCESSGLSRGKPVKVGNVTLWPLTIQAIYVIDEINIDEMDNDTQAYTLAYIMAHARDAGAFDGGIDTDIVEQWSRGLTCTPLELTDAINEINRQSTDYETGFNQKSDGDCDLSEFVGVCQKMFGETAEYWEREVSASYAMKIMVTEAMQQSGKSKSAKSAILTRAMSHYINEMKARSRDGED